MTEAVGAIIAAIIAGLVALFSLIISKEQNVSEFRQQWIDELRKDIAIVVARVSGIHGESINQHIHNTEPLWERVKGDLTDLNEVIARIRLRLNPNEKREKEGAATKSVLRVLEKLESIFANSQPKFHELQPLVTELVQNAQTILKENWDRVRSGEPVYRLTKLLTLFVVAACVAWFIWKFLQ